MSSILGTTDATAKTLDNRWSDIQKGDERILDLDYFTEIDISSDNTFRIPGLDSFVTSLSRQEMIHASEAFKPELEVLQVDPSIIPAMDLSKTETNYIIYSLLVFEQWVEWHLENWTKDHLEEPTACGKLLWTIQWYHETASKRYQELPEAFSIMLLTILELWVACEMIACKIHPELEDYDHEISTRIFSSLVLQQQKDMRRLSKAERYLGQRREQARFAPADGISVFTSFGDEDSFPARFFAQSDHHKDLLNKIETFAKIERERKREQLAELQAEYSQLRAEADALEHQQRFYRNKEGDEATRHDKKNCRRCLLSTQADRLSITVHEWPLPSRQVVAHCTVFELDVPPAFRSWRDVTLFFIRDVVLFSPRGVPLKTKITPQTYNGLQSFMDEESAKARITIVSQARSNLTKVLLKEAPNEESIFMSNRLIWRYHDVSLDIFLEKSVENEEVDRLCTVRLPECSMAMQTFLRRPPETPDGNPPNAVIASQHLCPSHFTVEEFKYLCSLPLGLRIQWLKVLAHLSMSYIDWKRTEAVLTLLHITYQRGPLREDGSAYAHQLLKDPRFAQTLLDKLDTALDRIKDNWESRQAVEVFSIISARLLSIGPTELRLRCLNFLRKCRKVCIEWIKAFEEEEDSSTLFHDAPESRKQERYHEIALICVDTFNVDQEHLESLLKSTDDARIFLQSSLLIRQNMPIQIEPGSLQSILLHRWRTLAFRSAPILIDQIVKKGDSCLDDAILCIWAAHRPARVWTTNLNVGYWLESKTGNYTSCEPMPISFNLFTAELMVNGAPLSRLPLRFEEHPTFRNLFGSSPLDVAPSSEPGMRYSITKLFYGMQVHLGSRTAGEDSDSWDLLVQTHRDRKVFNLVPTREFTGLLPKQLVRGFVHWFDGEEDAVEFRSSSTPWKSSSLNWRLTRVDGGWKLTKGDDETLICPESNTARKLSDVFSPMEERLGLQISHIQCRDKLIIEISRLQLSFELLLGASTLCSVQFKGMKVDESQNIGALVGLQNKLVLCNENGPKERIVLIPQGKVSWEGSEDVWDYGSGIHSHVLVKIDQSKEEKVLSYIVDTRLGQLKPSGDLQSRLYLVLLHGLTSYCLPDPLTGYTGTERALKILGSAATHSVDLLTQNDINILKLIARLTPGRIHSGRNRKTAQAISWIPNLAPLAQHGNFYKNIQEIFQDSIDTAFFYPSFIHPPKLDHVDRHLLDREAMRTSTYRVDGFGAEVHHTSWDALYTARECDHDSERSFRSFRAAASMARGEEALISPMRDDLSTHIYNLVSTSPTVNGPTPRMKDFEFQYDLKWLGDPSKLLSDNLCRIHWSLNGQLSHLNSFQLMMWLASIAFADRADDTVIEVLIAFITVPQLRQLGADVPNSCEPPKGMESQLSAIEKVVLAKEGPFKRGCPEKRLAPKPNETPRQLTRRQEIEFRENQRNYALQLPLELHEQWPAQMIDIPTVPHYEHYLLLDDVRREVNLLFDDWNRNKNFMTYLESIQDCMSSVAVKPIGLPSLSLQKCQYTAEARERYLAMPHLLALLEAPVIQDSVPFLSLKELIVLRSSISHPRMNIVIDEWSRGSHSSQEVRYFDDLRHSVSYLSERASEPVLLNTPIKTREILESYQEQAQSTVEAWYESIFAALDRRQKIRTSDSVSMRSIASTHQWPRISPLSMLEILTYRTWEEILPV